MAGRLQRVQKRCKGSALLREKGEGFQFRQNLPGRAAELHKGLQHGGALRRRARGAADGHKPLQVLCPHGLQQRLSGLAGNLCRV